MENSTAQEHSSGLMAPCTRVNGSTVGSKEEVSSWEKKAQFMKVSGLRGSIMDVVLCKLQQVKYILVDGKMASFQDDTTI